MPTGQYDVFISHAGAQKNLALWVRSHIQKRGYWAFVDERDLRCGPALPATPHRARNLWCAGCATVSLCA